jgi:hydroxyacylglutathione hydrolase
VPRPCGPRARRGVALLLAAALAGCTREIELVNTPPTAVALTTTGPWASMIYLARTDSGVIAIDLGWVGAERQLRSGLARLGATLADVRWVFLTHGHRDHVHGWPAVRGARFVLGAGEVPYLLGEREYSAVLPRLGDDAIPWRHPAPGELALVALGGDSLVALGRDTVFTFSVPGHTAGSTAYLFRGILFGGDAVNWRPGTGFQGARPEFSDDALLSRESMRALWTRLSPGRARVVCSAHAKCATADSAVREATAR